MNLMAQKNISRIPNSFRTAFKEGILGDAKPVMVNLDLYMYSKIFELE